MTWGFPMSATHTEKSSIWLSDSRDVKSIRRRYCSLSTCGLRSWIPLKQSEYIGETKTWNLTVLHVHGMQEQSTWLFLLVPWWWCRWTPVHWWEGMNPLLQVDADTQKCSIFGQLLQAKFLAHERMREALQFVKNHLVLSAIWTIWINSPDRNS